MTDREKLRNLLKEKSLKTGDFILASGKRSSYYFDSKLTTLTAEGSYLTGKCFFDIIVEAKIDAELIGGMTLGSDPIVTAAALVSRIEGKPVDAFIVRKEEKGHGTQKWIEGPAEKGQRTIIVDDVVTTGGSTFKAIEKAEEFGLKVVAVIALLDREEGGGEALSAKYPFYSVVKKSEIMG
jgi:orotate phosphoribosyltransferase